MKNKTPKIKFWLEEDGEIFGKGNYEILKAIEKFGSINESSKQLRMSYKKAWTKKTSTEKFLGGDIFISKKGASKDSGTILSPKALEFMKNYELLEKELEEFLEKRFNELFKKEE
ncbi:molybdenum transporter [Campylobacter sp. RM9333]|uniref:winged helix-turn-helix domain-containing protein n=1 Tax=Campylobacter sp. RM9333 TaxID=2735731 RepID=UPI001DBB8CCC|nr:molybdenum transporter [Campylobacter sp. RM9333]